MHDLDCKKCYMYCKKKLKITYRKYESIKTDQGLTGMEVANKILKEYDLDNIDVVEISGELTDNYNNSRKRVSLSSNIYGGKTIASAAVAAHECGHAIQDKEGYLFLKIRSSIVPLVNFSSYAGYFAILIGLIFSLMDLVFIGIIFEVVILAFQVITLPVEFNASHRALVQLKQLDIVDSSEHSKCRGMLIAAALTYVASVATTILQILRYVLMFRHDDDR